MHHQQPLVHQGLLRVWHAVHMTVEHKALGVTGVKVLDDATGTVEAYVSATGVVDSVKDNVLPGAYASTLERRKPKGVWAHDWSTPVSKTLEAKELEPGDTTLPAKLQNMGAGALYVKTQFNLATQAGRDAYENVKFYGDDQEWSIGYSVPVGGSEMKDGVRQIRQLELYEYSPVLFGANAHTATASVKDAQAAVRQARELPTQRKVDVQVDGSVEQYQDWFGDAAEMWAQQAYAATDADPPAWMASPDSGGGDAQTYRSVAVVATWPADRRAVFAVWDWDDDYDDPDYWDATFVADATVEGGWRVDGTPTPVQIVGTVVPDNDDAEDYAEIMEAAGLDRAAARVLLAVEGKAGRVLAQRHIDKLQSAINSLKDAMGKVKDVHAAASKPKPTGGGTAQEAANMNADQQAGVATAAAGSKAAVLPATELLEWERVRHQAASLT